MFNFIKKAGTTSTQDEKDRRKKDKKDRKDKQKRERSYMTTEEVLRLDEVRRSLKLRGRRKEKEKLPSGITADYTASFLASLDRSESPSSSSQLPGSPNATNFPPNVWTNRSASISCTTTDGLSLTQSDSSETSLNSLNNPSQSKNLPTVPPRPPKRGILKGPKISVTSRDTFVVTTVVPTAATTSQIVPETNGQTITTYYDSSSNELIRNTLQNEVIAYQNLPLSNGNNEIINGTNLTGDNPPSNFGNNLLVVTSTSPSNDSLTDTTTNSSFATPPFSLSPVAESQGFHRWSRTANFDDFNLPLPPIIKLILPKPRVLTINRQPAPRNDFGFSLRRAMIVERNFGNLYSPGSGIGSPINGPSIQMKAVIFAEPGAVVQHNNETGLLPGDRLLEVNGIPVDDKSREEIIDLIKSSKESVTVKVQPVAELSELSRRSCQDGRQIELDDSNIRGGTLRRSGSRRFNRPGAKSDIELATEQSFLSTDRLWLVHRAGFTAAFRLTAADDAQIDADKTLQPGKLRVRLEETNEILIVDEDDIEKANPPQFDRVEDLAQLRYLNESSVLHTLRQRYAENLIHTYAGGNMLIVNPMAPLAIYSDKVVAMFKGCKSEDLPPHIFSMAQTSYHNMLQTRKDQSLVFLGRSGSGKTINFKHSIQYLVLAASSTTGNTKSQLAPAPTKFLTIEKLCAIWRILENFGNCKTQMNSNATRFTQIFSLDFDQSGVVASASIQILLLERSRIGKRLDNESTFHIMYRMLAGVEGILRKELFLDAINAAEITNPFITPLHKHEDKQRAQEDFHKVCQAFSQLNVSEADQKVIWMVLAAIWHLGCAGAVKASSGTPTHKYQFAHPQCAQRAAHLLGTTVEELSRLIFGMSSGLGTPTAPRQPFRTPSPTDKNGILPGGEVTALEALEAMLVGLYSEVFNAVAALINRSISQPTHTVSSILLIDCPGFQNPASCGRQTGASFEDLCHNYLQERLQLLFHQTNLVQPKDRYAQEGIDCNFDEDENAGINPGPVVNLLDKSPQNTMLRTSQTDLSHSDRRGLFWLLDEEAIYPGSNDDSFLERLFTHYGDRESQLLLRKAPGNGQFVLQHLQGTNPVLYTANGWLKSSRENQVARGAVGLLQESSKEDISRMFVSVRGVGPSSMGGSVVGIEGSQSLRRASSIRRTFTAGTAGIKRKSMSLQVKFTVDGLIETLRRTKLRFIQCLLPQHNAGLCESNTALLAVKSASGQAEDSVINVPLIRSQLRGFQTLDSVRLYKQGFPCFLPLAEFRRRFRLLSGDNRPSSPVLDERKAVEDMLLNVDLDLMGYRVGMSQIFFRQQTLTHLESLRDNHLQDRVIALQSHCRGYIARKRLQQRRLQDLAVRCIQRNVRAFMAVRDWPWWRLMVRVAPVLGVVRQEELLKLKTEELEILKSKVEKLEQERTTLKHENDKLESKLSEITADLAEEHSTATLATERLDAETQERIRLERELDDVKNKNRSLQQSSERLEMELLYARSDMNGLNSEEDDDGEQDGGVYKQRYERVARELEFTRRRLQQQHEDDLEQLVGLKKQLEKKLADAYEEVEEQRQVVGQWKRKVQKLNAETNDLRLLLEEQNSRNNLLEKKQRKFDSETQLLQDELRQEKQTKERFAREKEIALAEKYTLENNVADIRLELDLATEKLHNLQREYDEITFGGKTEEEVTLLRKQKMELDRKLHEQEEELDELAGQTQLLEQAKLRLEMALEQSRKESKRLATQSEEELEEVRCNAQKKLKALEAQLETEHEERTILLREKHDLERRLASFHENERSTHAADEALLQRLKRDLRRTKALLRDAQTMLERQKADSPGKAVLRQLRNQLEDAECARQNAVKAKQTMETELSEAQQQFEEAQRLRNEAESKANAANRERAELRTQLEENEEELAEVLKKYKSAVQQMSVDQLALQEQVSLVSELETEKNTLKEQLIELNAKLESMENAGDATSNLVAKRLELRCKELESKLELEQTTRSRLEVQIARLKETVDKLQTELATSRIKEQQSQDQIRKLQRNLRESRDEHSAVSAREAECLQKRKELEKKIETAEAETSAAKADLRLAMKRIEDLQSAIQGELEDTISDNSDSEADSYSSDESIETFLANHKIAPSKSSGSSDRNSLRLDSSPN